MSVIAGDNSVAVNNALSDYSQCLDRGDEDEFVKLFAPEFTLEIAATNLKKRRKKNNHLSFHIKHLNFM